MRHVLSPAGQGRRPKGVDFSTSYSGEPYPVFIFWRHVVTWQCIHRHAVRVDQKCVRCISRASKRRSIAKLVPGLDASGSETKERFILRRALPRFDLLAACCDMAVHTPPRSTCRPEVREVHQSCKRRSIAKLVTGLDASGSETKERFILRRALPRFHLLAACCDMAVHTPPRSTCRPEVREVHQSCKRRSIAKLVTGLDASGSETKERYAKCVSCARRSIAKLRAELRTLRQSSGRGSAYTADAISTCQKLFAESASAVQAQAFHR